MIKFTHNGREYTVTETQNLPNLNAHLLARGFDGCTYYAEAKAVGRQRKDHSGMFFCSAKTGQFVSAI